MDRRTFLKVASACGLAVSSPFLASPARGEPESYDGPLYLFVHCGGGWDTSMFMDPKGYVTADDPDRVNNYPASEVGATGNLKFSPLPGHREFFETYRDRMTVVHGISVGTLAHSSGKRYSWTGTLRHTHPSIGALVAGALGPWMPLSFLFNGGTSPTMGIVNRVRGSELETLAETARPNRADFKSGDWQHYHSEYEEQLLQAAIEARLERRLGDPARLPKRRKADGTLQTAYLGKEELLRIEPFMPEQFYAGDNPLPRQAELAFAAYRAGLCVTATLSTGGWDSHESNDATQIPTTLQLIEGLDLVWQEAERLQIADRVVMVVMSDFGRSPRYNSANGKGHYPVTSMFVMSPRLQGNRVVGATTERLEPLSIDPDTLAIDEQGVALQPEHVHASIRQMAGIADHPLCAKFPLQAVETSPFFG